MSQRSSKNSDTSSRRSSRNSDRCTSPSRRSSRHTSPKRSISPSRRSSRNSNTSPPRRLSRTKAPGYGNTWRDIRAEPSRACTPKVTISTSDRDNAPRSEVRRISPKSQESHRPEIRRIPSSEVNISSRVIKPCRPDVPKINRKKELFKEETRRSGKEVIPVKKRSSRSKKGDERIKSVDRSQDINDRGLRALNRTIDLSGQNKTSTSSRPKRTKQDDKLEEDLMKVSEDDMEAFDAINMAFYINSRKPVEYTLGQKNPEFDRQHDCVSRIKSYIPEEIPEVDMMTGEIDCPFYYDEMRTYYLDKQNKITGDMTMDRDVKIAILRDLEMDFYYTYPSPPKPEDYNYRNDYKRKALEWINNERIRLEDGFVPGCIRAAQELLIKIDINPKWVEEHTWLVESYERQIDEEFKDHSRKIPEYLR